jgi:hypothetical protein
VLGVTADTSELIDDIELSEDNELGTKVTELKEESELNEENEESELVVVDREDRDESELIEDRLWEERDDRVLSELTEDEDTVTDFEDNELNDWELKLLAEIEVRDESDEADVEGEEVYEDNELIDEIEETELSDDR